MVNDLHYSFGDNLKEKFSELPHLVAPLLRGMDKVIVTPVGQQPPPMGHPFHESPDLRRSRMKTAEKFAVDINSVYRYKWQSIFSFIGIMFTITNTCDASRGLKLQREHVKSRPVFVEYSRYSSCQSLVSLSILIHVLNAGVPMINTLSMSNIFGEAGIRLVAYEMPAAAAKISPAKHPQRDVKYVFNMPINPVDPANFENFEEDRILSYEESDQRGRSDSFMPRLSMSPVNVDYEDEPIDCRIEDSDGEDDDLAQVGGGVAVKESPLFARIARNSIGSVMNRCVVTEVDRRKCLLKTHRLIPCTLPLALGSANRVKEMKQRKKQCFPRKM